MRADQTTKIPRGAGIASLLIAPVAFIAYWMAVAIAFGAAFTGYGVAEVVWSLVLIIGPPAAGIALGASTFRAGARVLGACGIACNVLVPVLVILMLYG